jgi:hypothetical protein
MLDAAPSSVTPAPSASAPQGSRVDELRDAALLDLVEINRIEESASKIAAEWQPHALSFGKRLLELKAEVGHNNWEPYVERELGLKPERAAEWTRIYKRRSELPPWIASKTAAIECLKKPRAKSAGGPRAFELGALKKRFPWPLVNFIDTREGEWQKRKRAWKKFGLKPEIKRAKSPAFVVSAKRNDDFAKALRKRGGEHSIFDPVLCEYAYEMFCPERGQVIDPFAGGAARGVVAAMAGLRYWGSELRREQVTANRDQADDLLLDSDHRPVWMHGDALALLPQAPKSDFVFTCPPYWILERYSDDPRDLSTMELDAFRNALQQIAHATIERLKDDRFACVVVGDCRDKQDGGAFIDLPGMLVDVFRWAGAGLYNRITIVRPYGTVGLRGPKYWSMRKLVNVHEQVLVFIKGDPKRAARACKQFPEPEGK